MEKEETMLQEVAASLANAKAISPHVALATGSRGLSPPAHRRVKCVLKRLLNGITGSHCVNRWAELRVSERRPLNGGSFVNVIDDVDDINSPTQNF